ncbi:hypothetical protein, conserved [Eimeria praecox]|uniref:Trichohyalin n=1 Tax=Eimeria praecox TaxID=51316 RepID=U6G5B1_9EIME|nr:hypothetical protein, conserved [Eimeria praecox]
MITKTQYWLSEYSVLGFRRIVIKESRQYLQSLGKPSIPLYKLLPFDLTGEKRKRNGVYKRLICVLSTDQLRKHINSCAAKSVTMMYPPKHSARKDPWTTTVNASYLKPSRYMDASRQQKLLLQKQEEEKHHHSVKLQSIATKRANGSAGLCCSAEAPATQAENSVPSTSAPEPLAAPNVAEGTTEPREEPLEEAQTPSTGDDGAPLNHRKTTQELTEEFKNLNWAKVDEYNSFKAKLEEQACAAERLRKKNWLRNELEAQLEEQRRQKEAAKLDDLECAKKLQQDLEQWKAQEREKQKVAYEKMQLQKEVLDAQMQERHKLEEESKAEQLRESREILEQVSRDIEIEKRMASKAKQQKARAMQEILEKELATQYALKRDAADQARKEAMEKEAAARKKAEQLKVHEFLKLQQEEKARRKQMEKQERYEIQRQQELDAEEYKRKQEAELRSRRELCKRQQELLIQQMEERKLNKDILVSQTEMKLNRRLLEEVNDYLAHKQQPSQEFRSTEC